MMKNKIILAIETTCDETAIAILKIDSSEKPTIIGNVVSSQIETHAPFGGVVPSLAKREHQQNLIPVLEKALSEAKLLKLRKRNQETITAKEEKTISKILSRDGILAEKTIAFFKRYEKPIVNFVAIAYGPGLEPALWPGINLARALSFFWKVEIEKINHIEAHILANWLPLINPQQRRKNEEKIKKTDFPIVAITVSGGHTQLVLTKEIGKYKIIGETRDDAAGECFDKAARLLGLGYPGGPAISKEAEIWKSSLNRESPNADRISLPRPMIHSKDFDFSFSGLKTAILQMAEKIKKENKKIPKKIIPEFSFEIQQAIIDVLIAKTIKAAEKFGAKTVVLAGGVSANSELRNQLAAAVEKLPKTKFSVPEIKYSTDNGAMIAMAAYFHLKTNQRNKSSWQRLCAKANLRV